MLIRPSVPTLIAGREVVLASASLFCLVLQLISATWFVAHFDTPNASTKIARYRVKTKCQMEVTGRTSGLPTPWKQVIGSAGNRADGLPCES